MTTSTTCERDGAAPPRAPCGSTSREQRPPTPSAAAPRSRRRAAWPSEDQRAARRRRPRAAQPPRLPAGVAVIDARARARRPRPTLVSSIARVIGPTPPGFGADPAGHLRHVRRRRRRRSCCRPRRAADADVEHGGAGLDHVGGDEAGHAGGGDDDVGPRARAAARSRVPVWHSVTVAFSVRRVSSSPSGRPTVMPRPTTHDVGAGDRDVVAAQQLDDARSACTAAAPASPSTSQPRLIGCRPSTSLSGSTRAEHRELVEARCGCWTRKPVQAGSALSSSTTRLDLGLGGRRRAARAGSLAMPISAQSWCLAPTYQRLPGSSPTSTVPRPGTTPALAQRGDPLGQLGLDRRAASPCRQRSRASRAAYPATVTIELREARYGDTLTAAADPGDPAGDDRPVRRAGRDAGRARPVRRARGAFLVAHLDGEPIGCAGLRGRTDGEVELKRMYDPGRAPPPWVRPLAADRGRGRARSLGYRRLVLETGTGSRRRSPCTSARATGPSTASGTTPTSRAAATTPRTSEAPRARPRRLVTPAAPAATSVTSTPTSTCTPMPGAGRRREQVEGDGGAELPGEHDEGEQQHPEVPHDDRRREDERDAAEGAPATPTTARAGSRGRAATRSAPGRRGRRAGSTCRSRSSARSWPSGCRVAAPTRPLVACCTVSSAPTNAATSGRHDHRGRGHRRGR